MRKTLLAAFAAGLVAAAFPASSASAYCDETLYQLTGECTNACMIAGRAYVTADSVVGVLPDAEWHCPA